MKSLDLRRNRVPVDRHGEYDGLRLENGRRDAVEIVVERAGFARLVARHAGVAAANLQKGGVEPLDGVAALLRSPDECLRHGKAVALAAGAARNDRNLHGGISLVIF